jgi:hypothetical protein
MVDGYQRFGGTYFKEEIRFFCLKELEAAGFSEMLIDMYRTTRCHISEDISICDCYGSM